MSIINFAQGAGVYIAYGLSTDTKPSTHTVDSLFIETDTGNTYISNGSSWLVSNNHKTVKSVTDFPAQSGGLITLEDNITYVINGTVDVGTNEIVLGVKNSFYGHKHSEDTLRKLSSVLKGRNSWNKGKKLSAGHRKKLSDAHKGWAWQTGHTRFDLPRIRELYAQGEKQTQLAQMFNTDSGTISRIVNRVNYTYEKSL